MNRRTGEFELIDTIVAQLGAASSGSSVLLGPGDDAALVAVPAGEALVTSVDTLLPDVHFPAGAAPQLIGERALRASVSDLAAMGAQPLACVISLVLPPEASASVSASWVRELSQGFAAAAQQFDCPVTGGNLSAGPLSICITVQGAVVQSQALLRSGAQPGDDVWVSGALGGAAAALAAGGLADVVYTAETTGDTSAANMTPQQQQYYLPLPQLALGIALRDIASSAIDISDGLAADLGHIARLSNVALELSSAAIPRFVGATLEQSLYGGDDYHLAFTAAVAQRERIGALQDGVCRIGVVASASVEDDSSTTAAGTGGKVWLDGVPLAQNGFDHFANRSQV